MNGKTTPPTPIAFFRGNQGNLNHRSQEVMAWLTELDFLYCLGITQCGFPRHPLYLKKDTPLMPYSP